MSVVSYQGQDPNRLTLDGLRASLVRLLRVRATKVAEIDKLILWASNGVMRQWLWREVNTYDREKVRFRHYAKFFLNSDPDL